MEERPETPGGFGSGRRRFTRYLVNTLLSFASLVAVLLFLEFVVFRVLLFTPQLPSPAFDDGVMKYEPDQWGVSGSKETPIPFRVNADGWNSAHSNYEPSKPPGVFRVAIVGDSYVAALNVGYGESLAEELERMLGPDSTQVYRFGIPGAPLSQYLQMVRREVLNYDPDLVAVVVVHNDFNESYAYEPGVYASSFLKLRIEDDKVVDEIEPTKYERHWYSFIRDGSAMWRYLAYKKGIRFQFLRDVILDREREYQVNIEVSTVKNLASRNEVATRYVVRGLKELTEAEGTQLLLLIDGVREPIYVGRDSDPMYESGPLRLNRMFERIAGEEGVDYVDLHRVFERDFRASGKRFNSETDSHWNRYGHRVVANAIYDYVRDSRLTVRLVGGNPNR